jgi:hypothetical protein
MPLSRVPAASPAPLGRRLGLAAAAFAPRSLHRHSSSATTTAGGRYAAAAAAGAAAEAGTATDEGGPTPAPRRRRGPRQQQQQPQSQQQEPQSAASPKKRGRPSKRKPTSDSGSGAAATTSSSSSLGSSNDKTAGRRLSPGEIPRLLTPLGDGEPRRYGQVELRPYQQLAIASVIRAWQSGQLQQLVSMPTGTGKTVVFSSLIRYVCEQVGAALAAGYGSSWETSTSSSSSSGATGAAAAAAAAAAVSEVEVLSPDGSSLVISSEQEDEQSAGGTADAAAAASSSSSSSGGVRILVLAHRGELLAQAEDTLRLVWPEVSVSVVSQESKDVSGQVRRSFLMRPTRARRRGWRKICVMTSP